MKGHRLIALFFLGVVLFVGPIPELFNRLQTVGGVPLLYVYLFAAWALLIVLVALAVEGPRRRVQRPGDEPPR